MFDDHLNTSKVTYFEHLRWATIAGIRLIYAGGLDASKGLDRFLTAFSRLQASDSLSYPIEMCICGSGSQDRLIEELCEHSLKGVKFLLQSKPTNC